MSFDKSRIARAVLSLVKADRFFVRPAICDVGDVTTGDFSCQSENEGKREIKASEGLMVFPDFDDHNVSRDNFGQ